MTQRLACVSIIGVIRTSPYIGIGASFRSIQVDNYNKNNDVLDCREEQAKQKIFKLFKYNPFITQNVIIGLK